MITEQAIEAYYVLKNKDTKLPIKYRSMMEFYASLFTTADGERLLRALEAFYELPKGTQKVKQCLPAPVFMKHYLTLKIRRQSLVMHESGPTVILAEWQTSQLRRPQRRLERQLINYTLATRILSWLQKII